MKKVVLIVVLVLICVFSITQALAFENTRHHLLYPIFDERNKINRVGAISFTDFLFGEEVL